MSNPTPTPTQCESAAMPKPQDGGFAFPQHGWTKDPEILERMKALGGGLTVRDYFACHALTGMLAYSYFNPSHGNFHENCGPVQAAQAAYGYADAMMEARKE